MTNVEIRCSGCNSRNRLDPGRILPSAAEVRCGHCRTQLLHPSTSPLLFLDPEQLSHPLDRTALMTLGRLPGIETLLKQILGAYSDAQLRFLFLADHVKISPDHLPDIWRLYARVGMRLDLKELPDLFLKRSLARESFVLGVDAPVVVLTTSLVDDLERDELFGVLGHELTHVLCQHSLYATAAQLLKRVGLSLLARRFPISIAVLTTLQIALKEWQRTAELTADRGQLIATGSLDCYIRTLMKIADGFHTTYDGMTVEAFLTQVDALDMEEDRGLINKAWSRFVNTQDSHSTTVWRARHIRDFAYSQEFFQVLAGQYRQRGWAAAR